jgi:rhodanese-related sulfurtransferase
MMTIKLLVFLFLIGSTVVISLAPSDYYKELEVTKNEVLIDVRMLDDYCTSRIANAVWAGNKEALDVLLDQISKDTPIFIYCELGKRSKDVTVILSKRKFNKVYELQGGFKKWQEHGFPIDSVALPKLSHE